MNKKEKRNEICRGLERKIIAIRKSLATILKKSILQPALNDAN